jgi:predicted AAA+ superfamily ATPase
MRTFWENKNWEKEDRHLTFLESMPFKRQFPFIPKEKGLYIIRGPRQIGKSSWLKSILKHYTDEGISCFYESCENIRDNHELAELLTSVKHCPVILLDEISFITNWDRAIKHAIDKGETQLLVITGPHTHDLKTGADLLPGRFDGGGEFELMPMLFHEFCQMRTMAGWSTTNRLHELDIYFKVGGFPTAVAEGGKEGVTPIKAMETYWKWLLGDITKLGKNPSFLEELMIQLVTCMQTPISFQTLSKKTSMSSHNTVQDYIQILESCFALRQLLCMDLDSSSLRYRKERKFYFTDPLLFWIGHKLSGKSEQENYEAKIAELVAHEQLKRSHKRFGYFSNKNGEVDFILPNEWAVEVKWASSATNLSKTYLQLTMPNKKVWTQQNFLL